MKENSQPKHEVHVLNKELDIRSQEREYERKAVDMASKQHLESVKKIAKLEEECNRLRLLVRKKLPGISSTSCHLKSFRLHTCNDVQIEPMS